MDEPLDEVIHLRYWFCDIKFECDEKFPLLKNIREHFLIYYTIIYSLYGKQNYGSNTF